MSHTSNISKLSGHNFEEVIRLSTENLNVGYNKTVDKETRVREKSNEESSATKFRENCFEKTEETHSRRRKGKLERQMRCTSNESDKYCKKDIFTLADLQEEMK